MTATDIAEGEPLSAADVAIFAEDLAYADAVAPGLGAQLLAFVLNGEQPALFAEFGGLVLLDKAADPPVRLGAASLRRHRPDCDEPCDFHGARLGRAPPILVSELWHDFKAIADAGSGPSTEGESAG